MKKISCLILFIICQGAFAHAPKVVPPGAVEAIPFPGHKTLLLTKADDSPSEVAILELELPAKSFGAPPHVHLNEDEHFYVLEGKVDFLQEDKIIPVEKGGLVVLPRGSLHGFWNDSEQPARLLLVVSPGEFASFFDNVVAEIRKQNPDRPDLVGAIIAKEAQKLGVEIHPDKMPQAALALMPR
ncbi:cupin domain-containing protein [Planctobacterium marinum]|uniref:cupin domain-containing protein n=1 Tax=Planctobacterium marinum TaxID=1631968 RepID=UPI001E555FB9|nr:cupin domain-containing protein [Planctobacterium marinum]MCC2604758.1 cupin domain-containing protein [Planctobacterium marinum]